MWVDFWCVQYDKDAASPGKGSVEDYESDGNIQDIKDILDSGETPEEWEIMEELLAEDAPTLPTLKRQN